MTRPSWDELYMSMCYMVASRSPDQSTHSGCYIVDSDYCPVSFGYNGFPRGIEDSPERQERPLKYQYFEHAERNAIYNASRVGKSLLGCRLYVNWVPCADCARGIIQSGITKVIIHKHGQDAFHMSRNDTVWSEDHNIVFDLWDEAGVDHSWYAGPIQFGLYGVWSGKKYMFTGPHYGPVEVA